MTQEKQDLVVLDSTCENESRVDFRKLGRMTGERSQKLRQGELGCCDFELYGFAVERFLRGAVFPFVGSRSRSSDFRLALSPDCSGVTWSIHADWLTPYFPEQIRTISSQ
jgi:hypothetical protein